MLAINADNAPSNNTQTTALANMDNSFEQVNRVRCFNHTLQLSSKALLKPFNAGIAGKPDDEPVDCEDDDMPSLVDVDDEDENGDNDDGTDEHEDENGMEDDGIDELDNLSEEERAQLLADTAAIRTMVSKVYSSLYNALFMTNCINRSVGSPSPLFVQPQLLFRHGARHVLNVVSS
jgi:hypothetical protein